MDEKILSGMGKWSAEYDENGVCTKAVYDDAYLKLIGIENERDESDSQNDWKADVHPDDIEKIEENAKELFAKHPEGMDYDLEYRMMTPKGYHWFHDYGLCTRREDGSVLRMDGIIFDIQDIVDKEALRRELVESNLRILSLEDDFESLYDVELETGRYEVFMKDGSRKSAKGDKESSNFFKELPELVKYRVYPEDRDALCSVMTLDLIKKELSEGDHFDYYYRVVTEDKPVWFSIRIVYKNAERKEVIIGVFNAENDIAFNQLKEQQKQLEEALAMAQSANRAKTTFLNNMSHDIRTPMNAIIGYTGLAASHIESKERVLEYLSKIAQSSDHLLSLINDVLDMSRIESGKMNIDEKEENLASVIHMLRDIVQADLHSKQLDFYIDAVGVNDENVICDKLRLCQVLLNILSNAIKFTPAGGTVAMRITETAVKNNGYAEYEFRIKDTGIGMTKEFLETVFDPFTREKNSTVSGIQGTGLGMAIAKNITDMMGGSIEISSEPGKGTEVVIIFDFKLQKEPASQTKIAEFNGMRALVADDDSNTCLSVCGMIEDIGMRCEWCTSGKEAVIRAGDAYQRGDSFKVYIIDWIMPDMNGIETTRRIRRVIGEDAPVIILTAYDWSDIEEEAREAGVTAFVSKPMFPSDLHRVLNNCLGKEENNQEDNTVKYDFSGRKILLVEDNELNREIAFEILSENGFMVDVAEDGNIAVEKMKSAKKGDYDLVLMDLQMPAMDGCEATRQIRKLSTEISKIPIIAMTANAFEEDRKLALEAGMNEHIAKPIDVNKLNEVLARFL